MFLILGIDGFTGLLREWDRIQKKWPNKKVILVFRLQEHYLVEKPIPDEVTEELYLDKAIHVGYLPVRLADLTDLSQSSTILEFVKEDFLHSVEMRDTTGLSELY